MDAAEVIAFDEEGKLDGAKTDRLLAERLNACEQAVVPGFYGSRPDGSVKTFSAEALTSPALWWRRPFTRTCMKTGPMYPAF